MVVVFRYVKTKDKELLKQFEVKIQRLNTV